MHVIIIKQKLSAEKWLALNAICEAITGNRNEFSQPKDGAYPSPQESPSADPAIPAMPSPASNRFTPEKRALLEIRDILAGVTGEIPPSTARRLQHLIQRAETQHGCFQRPPGMGAGPLEIVINGPIASGKTRLQKWLARQLLTMGHEVLLTDRNQPRLLASHEGTDLPDIPKEIFIRTDLTEPHPNSKPVSQPPAA